MYEYLCVGHCPSHLNIVDKTKPLFPKTDILVGRGQQGNYDTFFKVCIPDGNWVLGGKVEERKVESGEGKGDAILSQMAQEGPSEEVTLE